MILLVEDHADTAALMMRLLKHCSFDAVAVSGGAAALQWVRANRPAVIVLDLAMPDMNGLDVIAAVRERPGLDDVPIVVYTGNATEIATRQARELGANDVLIKGSVDIMHLCEVIRQRAGAQDAPA